MSERMQRKNFLNELFDEDAVRQAEDNRNRNISKFMQCFNVTGNIRTKQIRILQVGSPDVSNLTKKPFLITQPLKKQDICLINNEIIFSGASSKDVLMQVAKTGVYGESSPTQKGHSRTISPDKNAFMAATQYVAISSNSKRTRGWIARKKQVEQLPRQFYRKSSQNTAISNQPEVQVQQYVSRSVNLLNKIKLIDQYPILVHDNNKSGTVIQHKSKIRFDADRKTPQQKADIERRAKLQIKKQINQDYAKPFNPPTNITAASYIIFEPKFSEYRGRRKKYYLQAEETQIKDKGAQKQDIQKGRKKYPHSHKVLASFNSRNAVQIASLTKIMTCVVALQICEKFHLDAKQQKILVGKFQSNIGGTSAQISEGQTYTLQDLYYGLMLPSGNDASVAIAVWGGRVLLTKSLPPLQRLTQTFKKKQCYQQFIKEMNIKAQSLDMHKTKYANSHGLCNPENKSCAFDLAILCEHAMSNSKFRIIVSCRNYKNTISCQQIVNTTINCNAISKKSSVKDLSNKGDDQIQEGEDKDMDSNQDQPQPESETQLPPSTIITQRQVQWQNTHRLVQSKPSEYIGIKTGITTAAGPCLASCIRTQSGRCFIIIVLNCDKLSMRFKDTENLKKWVYQKENMTIVTSPRKNNRQQDKKLVQGTDNVREECMSPLPF